jgi:hypothetical protein
MFGDLAWSNRLNGLVVTVVPLPGTEGDDRLALQRIAQKLSYLALPKGPGCPYAAFDFPSEMPMGEIGFRRTCLGNNRGGPRRAVSLLAYDPGRKSTRRLVPYKLPIGFGRFSYSRRTRRGVGTEGSGLADQLVWLEQPGLNVIPLDIQIPATPVWSPSGRILGLTGTSLGATANGMAAADLPWSLYRTSPPAFRLRPLVTDAVEILPFSWAPDGRWIAAAIAFRDGRKGVWLVNARDGNLKRVLPDRGDQFGAVAWMPGHRLAVSVGTFADFEPPKTHRIGIKIIRLD